MCTSMLQAHFVVGSNQQSNFEGNGLALNCIGDGPLHSCRSMPRNEGGVKNTFE